VCRLPTANEEGTGRNETSTLVPALAAPFGNSQPESFFFQQQMSRLAFAVVVFA
jgi:hypothetical protein